VKVRLKPTELPDACAFAVSRETERHERVREELSFPVFTARLYIKWNWALVSFFGFVEIIAEKHQNFF
jgi:hypothetical protein